MCCSEVFLNNLISTELLPTAEGFSSGIFFERRNLLLLDTLSNVSESLSLLDIESRSPKQTQKSRKK